MHKHSPRDWIDDNAARLIGMKLGGAWFAGPLLSLLSIFATVTKPFRAMWLAYAYVLTGQKVEKPYKWSDI